MTKSKCIDKNGKVVRVSLHPTKREIWNGHSFYGRLRLIKAKGLVLQNRSMS